MLSVENFYAIIKNNFANNSNCQLLCSRLPGMKQISEWGKFDEPWDNHILRPSQAKHKTDFFYMYDQEPLFASAVDNIRSFMLDNSDPAHHALIYDTAFEILLALHVLSRNVRIPIWCHSELNSPEIDRLSQALFVPCYYWYHAFIAREWYRHWHRYRSLNPENRSDSQWRFLLYARDFSGTREYRLKILDHLVPWKHMIKYDWCRTKEIPPEYSATISVEDAISCGIHLVAETLFDTQKIYLTEKVFKPMVMSQPFIVWAPPGTLACLRRYGFLTFDHVWSEAYDLETDADQRLNMLRNLVADLADLSSSEYHALYEKCLPVLAHNRNRFYSQEFMDYCWDELVANMESAFDTRNELLANSPGGQFFSVIGRFPSLLQVGSLAGVAKNLLKNLDHQTAQAIRDRYVIFAR